MPSKKDYPKRFNPKYPPSFTLVEPKKEIEIETRKYKDCILSSGRITLPEGTYEFSLRYGDEIEIHEIVKEPKPNINFAHQLANYNIAKALYDDQLAEWQKHKDKWDAEEAAEIEAKERKLLAELKAKYKDA